MSWLGGVLRAKLTMFDDVVTVMIRLTMRKIAMPGELWSISLVGCIKIRFGVFVGEIIEKKNTILPLQLRSTRSLSTIICEEWYVEMPRN